MSKIALLLLLMAACVERGAPGSTPPSRPAATQDASTGVVGVVRLEDAANRLTAGERAKLTAQLQPLTSTSGSNVGILIVSTINDENIDGLARRTFSTWNLGDKGVLLVLAMQEHRSRIETGHGIEAVLTDDLCGQVLRDMRPHLQQGEVYEALHEGLEAIDSILQRQGDAGTKPQRVGRTFSNGNCALDSNQKLTGLCVGSDGSGTKCIAHEPDPNSPPCTPGTTVKETRTAACSTASSQETVSREHQCYFLRDP